MQGTKLMQLQHFLSWNKANIKHSCKLQLYKLIYKNIIFRIYTKGCVRIFEYACAWFNHAYVWHCFRLISLSNSSKQHWRKEEVDRLEEKEENMLKSKLQAVCTLKATYSVILVCTIH